MSVKRERRISLVLDAADGLAAGADEVTEIVREIAARAGCSERTVFRDVARLRAGQLDGGGEPALPEDQLDAYLRTMNASQAWRELGGRDGTGMSKRSFQRHVRTAVPRGVEAGLRHGVPGSFATSIVAPRMPTEPNERWEIDTKQLRVTVVDEDGLEVRVVNLVALIDHTTRVIIDWQIVYAPVTGVDVRRLLTRAMLGHVIDGTLVGGIPDSIVTDQGADYTSTDVQRVTDAVRCLLDPLPPYSPHLKGTVERFFSTLDMQWTRGLPGYVGEALRADETVIRDGRAMHGEDLETSLSVWMAEYHRREHGSLGHAPIDAWRAAGFWPKIPTVDQVAPFLEDRYVRTVTTKGLRVDNRMFKCQELGDHMGAELEVHTIDGARLAEVFLGNRHVGRAVAEDDWTEDDLDSLVGSRELKTSKVKELRTRRDEARRATTRSTTRPAPTRSTRDSKRSQLLPRGEGLNALRKRADVGTAAEQLELT